MPGLEAAKAYVALAGSIATALLAVYAADTTVGQVLTVVSVIATAFGTWAVENKPATVKPQGGHVDLAVVLLVGIAVVLVLVLAGRV